MKKTNRVLSLLLCIVMIIGMLTAFCLPALAEAIASISLDESVYIDVAEGELKVYKFTPAETGTYKFYSYDASGDPKAKVYSEYDNISSDLSIAGNDDIEGDVNFSIVTDLQAGVTVFVCYSASVDSSYYTKIEKIKKASSVEIIGDDSFTAYKFSSKSLEYVLYPEGCADESATWQADDSNIVSFIGDEMFFNAPGTTTVTVTTENGLTDSINVTVVETEVDELKDEMELPSPYTEGIYGNIFKFVAKDSGFFRIGFYGENYPTSAQVLDAQGNSVQEFYWSTGDVYLEKDNTYYLVYDPDESTKMRYFKPVMPEYIEIYYDKVVAYENASYDNSYYLEPYDCAMIPVDFTSGNDSVVNINMVDEHHVYFSCLQPGNVKITATSEYSNITAAFDVTVIAAETVKENQEYKFDFTKVTTGQSVFKFTPDQSADYTFLFKSDESVSVYIDGFKNDGLQEGKKVKITEFFEQGRTYYFYVNGQEAYSVIGKNTVDATGIAIDQGEQIYVGEHDEFEITASTVPFNSREEDVLFSVVNSGDNLDYYGNHFWAVKPGTAKITASTIGESPMTATSDVVVTEAEEIKCGQTLKKNFGGNTLSYTYKFIPEQDGQYFINQSYANHILMSNYGYSYPNAYYVNELTKGETYYFVVKNTNGRDWSSEISVNKCSDVTSVTISDEFDDISWHILNQCTSLTDIKISDTHPEYKAVDGVVYTKDMKTVIYCAKGKEGKITLADSAEEICMEAFLDCKKLTEVVIPDTVKFIGDRAFSNSGITNVKMPSSLMEIAYAAFNNCTALKEVSLPKSVKTIKASAFENCSNLSDIYYEGTEEEFKLITVEEDGNDAFLKAKVHYNVNLCTHVYDNACDTTCNKCAEVRETSHVFGDYVSDNNATTQKDGTKTRKCSVCGYTETIQDVGTKLPVIIQDTTTIFSDIKADKWYTKAVNYAYSYGFIKGMSDTEFGRNENITRAMFITILARIAGVNTSGSANKVETKFNDVEKGRYYTGAIKWASENGVVSGITETEFGPNAPIERQQLCVMIVNFAKKTGVTLSDDNKKIDFKDEASIRKYAKKAIIACQKAGIISGYAVAGGTEFRPLETATRAEAAQILYKFHKDFYAVQK